MKLLFWNKSAYAKPNLFYWKLFNLIIFSFEKLLNFLEHILSTIDISSGSLTHYDTETKMC